MHFGLLACVAFSLSFDWSFILRLSSEKLLTTILEDKKNEKRKINSKYIGMELKICQNKKIMYFIVCQILK